MQQKCISVILIFVTLFFTTGCSFAYKHPYTPNKRVNVGIKNYGQHKFMSGVLPAPPGLEPGEVSVGKAISILKKGQTAPFTGVLLSPEATADLISRLENYDDSCKLKIDKELQIQKAQSDLKYEQLKITSNTYKKNCEVKLSSRDDTINLLNKTLEKRADPKTEWWFIGGVAGGFVLGAAITIATVYATSNAFK